MCLIFDFPLLNIICNINNEENNGWGQSSSFMKQIMFFLFILIEQYTFIRYN